MSEFESADVLQLRSLTEKLLVCANNAEWDAAMAIEADRRQLLYRIFGADVAPGTHSRHQALLNEILAADRAVMDLAKQRRAELAELVRHVGQGRTARQAYKNNRG